MKDTIILKFEKYPELKAMIEAAALKEQRSYSSLARKALLDYCEKCLEESKNG